MEHYLERSAYIDWKHPLLVAKASELAAGSHADETVAQRCYQFVRDTISHSWDAKQGPVTSKASEVFIHGTGFCYSKSHLLAALLRANAIPAGICYQRLSVGTGGPPYSLHALNAVYLKQHGWYRIDARGNKPGVTAAFNPPKENLAFSIIEASERDLPEIWAEPLPIIVRALTQNETIEQVYANLPDIEILRCASLTGH
jgi:transglutaminase-like putative cysteine protease